MQGEAWLTQHKGTDTWKTNSVFLGCELHCDVIFCDILSKLHVGEQGRIVQGSSRPPLMTTCRQETVRREYQVPCCTKREHVNVTVRRVKAEEDTCIIRTVEHKNKGEATKS